MPVIRKVQKAGAAIGFGYNLSESKENIWFNDN
jgi:hypothetical protein